MTAASLTIDKSTGPKVVPGEGSDGAVAKASAAAAPSLSRLKRERSQLAGRLERMAAARVELEAPAHALDNIEAEQRAAESDIAGALSAWAQSGCDGHRPVPNAALAPASPGAGKQLGPN
jgi:hypothetical protein